MSLINWPGTTLGAVEAATQMLAVLMAEKLEEVGSDKASIVTEMIKRLNGDEPPAAAKTPKTKKTGPDGSPIPQSEKQREAHAKTALGRIVAVVLKENGITAPERPKVPKGAPKPPATPEEEEFRKMVTSFVELAHAEAHADVWSEWMNKMTYKDGEADTASRYEFLRSKVPAWLGKKPASASKKPKPAAAAGAGTVDSDESESAAEEDDSAAETSSDDDAALVTYVERVLRIGQGPKYHPELTKHLPSDDEEAMKRLYKQVSRELTRRSKKDNNKELLDTTLARSPAAKKFKDQVVAYVEAAKNILGVS